MHARKAPFKLMPALICFAAVLWLVAACGEYKENSSTKEEVKTMTSETTDENGECATDSSAENGSTTTAEDGSTTSAENGSTTTTPENTPERIHEVRLKYDPLFWRQPNVHGVGEGFFRDENGEWTEASGIVISVTEKVDQSTLPAEDRIPDCLEGVPVQIIEEGPPKLLFESLEDTDMEEANGHI